MNRTIVRSHLKRGFGVLKDPSLVVVIAVLFIAVAPSAAQDCPGATQEGWDGGDVHRGLIPAADQGVGASSASGEDGRSAIFSSRFERRRS